MSVCSNSVKFKGESRFLAAVFDPSGAGPMGAKCANEQFLQRGVISLGSCHRPATAQFLKGDFYKNDTPPFTHCCGRPNNPIVLTFSLIESFISQLSFSKADQRPVP